MAESFAQLRKNSELLFSGAVRKGGTETTPKEINSAVSEFAGELGADAKFIPVIADQYGLYGWCSDGVLEKVKHEGGSILFGWTIWEYPGVLLTGEFHAVWRQDNGDMFDITPKPQGECRIAFVPNDWYQSNFNFDLRPRNRRKSLLRQPDFKALAEDKIRSMSESQLRYENVRAQKAEKSLLDWVADKIPRNRRADLVEEFILACNQQEEKLDSFPGAEFVPDDEFIRLNKRRDLLLQKFLKEFGV